MRHFFFFNDTATTEIYTLSLHDALPICSSSACGDANRENARAIASSRSISARMRAAVSSNVASKSRSEEHTSELQSLAYLVCRLLLEKKKNDIRSYI